MTDLPRVTTVILNWNGLQDTRECLHSLQAIDYPANHVIVVDNGSENAEADEIAREFRAFVELVRSSANLGFAGGANLGIKRALERGTDYVLLLNNDTVADPGFLTQMARAAEEIPDLAAACPKAYFYGQPRVIYSTGGQVSLWKGTAKQVGGGQEDRGQFERIARRDYADGLCMLIPAKALEAVGLLDEEYFAYWEETDWCVRAREKGLHCYYIPQARIWHKAERVQKPDARFRYLFRRNAFLFVRKRGTKLQLATALAMHLFVYGPWHLIRNPARILRIVPELRALVWHARNRPKERPLV